MNSNSYTMWTALVQLIFLLPFAFPQLVPAGSGLLYGGNFTYEPVVKKIFGLDFLGWGFDASYRDPFFALKPQLFKFSFNDNPQASEKTYRYPAQDVEYSVPDQVYVRTVSRTNTETYIFRNTRDKRNALDLKLNLKASTPQIEGELNFGLNIVKDSEEDKRIVMNRAETSLYQLYLSRPILRDDFLLSANELAATYSLDPESYNLFIYKYGTHYVDSIVIGGSIEQESIVTTKSGSDVLQIAAVLKGKFQSATGTKVEGNITLDFSNVEKEVETTTTSTSEIYGGDPEFTDFVLTGGDPAAAKVLFESWKASLTSNPVGIRYRLVEMWQLLPTQIQKEEMCKAIGTLLGFLPGDSSYCAKTSKILDGTIQKGLAVK